MKDRQRNREPARRSQEERRPAVAAAVRRQRSCREMEIRERPIGTREESACPPEAKLTTFNARFITDPSWKMEENEPKRARTVSGVNARILKDQWGTGMDGTAHPPRAGSMLDIHGPPFRRRTSAGTNSWSDRRGAGEILADPMRSGRFSRRFPAPETLPKNPSHTSCSTRRAHR